MAKKRAKRFDEGGGIDTDYAYDPISEITGDAEIGKANSRHYFNPLDPKETARARGIDHGEGYSGDKTASYKAEPAPAKKERIVSKKELADTGLTLREFLNRERGLKPRDGKAPKKATEISVEKPAPASKPAKTSKEEIDEIVKRTPLKNPSGGFDFMNALRRNQEVGGATMKESGRQARVDRLRRNVGTNQETYGMKKGGKVSSASGRGDGIAQRGKTKGRIC
jgi:hypothetical protein